MMFSLSLCSLFENNLTGHISNILVAYEVLKSPNSAEAKTAGKTPGADDDSAYVVSKDFFFSDFFCCYSL